jgi:hypothetical protein
VKPALGVRGATDPSWPAGIRNLEADAEMLEIACDGRVTRGSRSFIDAPTVISVPVRSPAMTSPLPSANRLHAMLALLVALVGAGAACGASNQSSHDGTTVTLERPGGSAAAPPGSAPAPAPSK